MRKSTEQRDKKKLRCNGCFISMCRDTATHAYTNIYVLCGVCLYICLFMFVCVHSLLSNFNFQFFYLWRLYEYLGQIVVMLCFAPIYLMIHGTVWRLEYIPLIRRQYSASLYICAVPYCSFVCLESAWNKVHVWTSFVQKLFNSKQVVLNFSLALIYSKIFGKWMFCMEKLVESRLFQFFFFLNRKNKAILSQILPLIRNVLYLFVMEQFDVS